MYGFHGRLLHVDLTAGTHAWHTIAESRLRAFLGGIGLGTSLLYQFAPAGVNPYAAANPLIFASAPLVDTGVTTTAKFAVVTKSPLTGFIADSLSSSFFALELKRIGIDALVVTGAAVTPVYLKITESAVEVREAAHLWGKSASETETVLREALDDYELHIAAIGKEIGRAHV